MGLDICWPIGSMFTLIGVLLSGYGVFRSSESLSLGLNINLIWGLALTVFGMAMLASAIHTAKKRKSTLIDRGPSAAPNEVTLTRD